MPWLKTSASQTHVILPRSQSIQFSAVHASVPWSPKTSAQGRPTRTPGFSFQSHSCRRAAPGLLQESPKAAPGLPQGAPGLPQGCPRAAPRLPRLPQCLSQGSPKAGLSEGWPALGLPGAEPRLPQGCPRAAPGLPQSCPRAAPRLLQSCLRARRGHRINQVGSGSPVHHFPNNFSKQKKVLLKRWLKRQNLFIEMPP